MASGTNLDDIVEPGFYPGFAADPINKPGGASSGFLTVAELSTGVATSVRQEWQDYGMYGTWRRNRGTGGWGPWLRTDDIPRVAEPLATGNATTVGPGRHDVPNAHTVTGLPSAEGGLLTRTGVIDTYVTRGEVSSTFERRLRPDGLWTTWARIAGEKVAPLAITRPQAMLTETNTSRSVRTPFTVPTRVRKWRVVIRNANYRTNTAYAGGVTIRTLCVGTADHDAAGAITSSFTPSGTFPSGLRIILRDASVADMGAGYTSPWVTSELVPGVDYMMSLGYQTNRQEVHLGMGGGWWTNGNPMNAELTSGPTGAAVKRLPFDIRIETVLDTDDPVDVIIGDSIAAASSATLPVREAPLAIANRSAGRAVRTHAFGGAAMSEWIGVNWGDPASMKWTDVTNYGPADRVLIALGNNDIHAGTNLTTLQANLATLVGLVRERLTSTVLVATVTPRTAWTGTANETLRAAFNNWLRSFPAGIDGIVDQAAAVENEAGNAPRADLVATDGIHFTSSGTAALASAIR